MYESNGTLSSLEGIGIKPQYQWTGTTLRACEGSSNFGSSTWDGDTLEWSSDSKTVSTTLRWKPGKHCYQNSQCLWYWQQEDSKLETENETEWWQVVGDVPHPLLMSLQLMREHRLRDPETSKEGQIIQGSVDFQSLTIGERIKAGSFGTYSPDISQFLQLECTEEHTKEQKHSSKRFRMKT